MENLVPELIFPVQKIHVHINSYCIYLKPLGPGNEVDIFQIVDQKNVVCASVRECIRE